VRADRPELVGRSPALGVVSVIIRYVNVILDHWSFFDVDPHYLMGKLTFDVNLMRERRKS
jgi:hypothetical protein